jgi:hypothetical protein
MNQGVPPELVSSMRRLNDEIAPYDLGLATRAFHGLVAVYGRIACGAAVRRITRESPTWISS